MNGCLRLGRSAVLIALGMGIGIVLGSLIPPVTGAAPDTLGIATCRISQSLFRVQVTSQGSQTIVSGDGNVQGGTSGVVLVAIDGSGRTVQTRGVLVSGYVGTGFKAVVPISKESLREVTICIF